MRAAHERIWLHCTSLFGRRPDRSLAYCGSGTFVRSGSRRCLLTASHVWRPLSQFPEVAWGLADDRWSAAFSIDNLVCLHATATPQEERWGPDLALIEILAPQADRLMDAGKTFYDLTRRREEALS